MKNKEIIWLIGLIVLLILIVSVSAVLGIWQLMVFIDQEDVVSDKQQVEDSVDEEYEIVDSADRKMIDWIQKSVEDVAKVRTYAEGDEDYDKLWELLHPDDKLVWESKEEFAEANEIRQSNNTRGGNAYSFNFLGEVKMCDGWISATNNQTYNDVFIVEVYRYAHTGIHHTMTINTWQYYQMIDGKFNFLMDQPKEHYQGGVFSYGQMPHYECTHQ
ncbi:hypothetical protein KJ855_01770 [Patescibacteria group bacterium]|nr:hypothetical protein [Patescibacteria group bacterium]